jgi:glycosyltransferase involved in cell wall biosynthesis
VRIGLDWRPTYSPRGGIPAYVRGLVSGLVERFPDDQVLLYGHRLRQRPPSRTKPAGARLHAAPIPTMAVEALARLGFGADRLIGGCDVLHVTDYAWLRPSRAPLVATVHDVLFAELPLCYTPAMRRGLAHVTRRFVRHAARIVVPSVRSKVSLVERFGADPGRVDVVPLAPRPLPSAEPAVLDRPFALAVGTLEPRKNLLRVLAAHRLARGRGLDAALVVVGARGWLDDDTVVALAAAGDDVRFEGDVDDARLAALYAGARALVYPSLGEGFGLPVIEAMAAGLPVVTSAGTACADVAGEAALLVDPYDVDAIATSLSRAIEDDGLRSDLAARGRARARELTWAKTAEGTRASYERATRAHATGSPS